MAKKPSPKPTEKELEILRVLWSIVEGTVRQVNEKINAQSKTGYTTTLKLMQIMHEKGLLVCDKSQFKHVFRPAISEDRTQETLVGDLLEKAFSGSAEKLVMRALSAKKITAEELKRIKSLIEKQEGK